MTLDLTEDKSTLVQEVMAWCLRQQAIAWANVDPDLCHHMASLGHNELKCYMLARDSLMAQNDCPTECVSISHNTKIHHEIKAHVLVNQLCNMLSVLSNQLDTKFISQKSNANQMNCIELVLWNEQEHNLTHWGWDKIATILQMTFSNAFSE